MAEENIQCIRDIVPCMMNRDGIYSHIHMGDPNRVLYIERWRDEPLPYDPIDTEALRNATSALFSSRLFEDEEDEIGLPMNAATIGFRAPKSRRTLCEPPWMDTDVFDRFRDEDLALHRLRDHTLLGSLKSNAEGLEGEESGQATIALFLAHGMSIGAMSRDDTTPNESISRLHGDLSINSELNNTFAQLRVSSSVHTALPQVPGSNTIPHPAQTPRPARRASSERVFETPIARIIR